MKALGAFGLGIVVGISGLVIGFGLPVSLANSVVARPSASDTTKAKYDWSAYEVRLEGERTSINGIEAQTVDFDGSCLVIGTDGSSESKSIKGRTSQTLNYTGRGISCNFQKQRANEERLKAVVRRDGQIVKTVDTTAEYGIVSFAL